MKRDSSGNMIPMVQKWSRPPLSCLPCREKKRRCDRAQPCSNCVLRNINCEYSGPTPESLDGGLLQTSVPAGPNQHAMAQASLQSDTLSHNIDELLFRIRRLEDALAQTTKSTQNAMHKYADSPMSSGAMSTQTFTAHYVTPFNAHVMSSTNRQDNQDRGYPNIIEISKNLPPLRQAQALFDHYDVNIQPTFMVLHIPSSRKMMEETYRCILEGEAPPADQLLLLFSIFSGSALFWTSSLLEKLKATREEARAAFLAYSRIAEMIMDHPARLVVASTTAIVAAGTMAHLHMNTDGFPVKVHLFRHRCLMMARELQIHRLDTAKSREERRLKGCDMIDVEVRRRVWWNMVASDWLLSFSGDGQEGAYMFQPKHMNVNLPSNTDDEFITAEGVLQEFPLTVPTSISGFIFRVKGADLCREVIDALPSVLLDSQEPDYDTILALDSRFQACLEGLPFFFKLDNESIEQSKEICRERPYISYQRLQVHFSLHTRLCRLHRRYHIEGITNPKYAYSHMVCIRSAHKVLELRRAMDDLDIDFKAARFGVVMNHVFSAALVLALDVSFNPQAPDAEARKSKVCAAYQILEQSREESNYLMAGISKNLQTLMSTLHRNRSDASLAPQVDHPRGHSVAPGVAGHQQQGDGLVSQVLKPLPGSYDEGLATAPPSLVTDGGNLINNLGQDDWERLWGEFVAVAPDLDAPQWNSLLEDVDLIF